MKFYCSASTQKSVLRLVEWWQSHDETIEIKTSGSTGPPKTMAVSKDQILRSIERTQKYFDIQKGQKFVLCLPLSGVGGMMQVFRALALEGQLLVFEPRREVFDDIETHNITDGFVAVVPLQIQYAFQKKSKALNQQWKLMIGGAAVLDSLAKEIEDLEVPCFETYGMTETLSHIALKPLNGRQRSNFFEGLQGIQLKTDEAGALVLRVSDQSEWIPTNDLVNLSQNKFQILGRKDQVINSGGVKIHLLGLEAKLSKVLTKPFFCCGVDDEIWGQALAVLIESSPFEIDFSEIEFEKHHKPKYLIFVAKFAETHSGKIDKLTTIKSIEENTVPNSRFHFATIFEGR